MGRKQILNTKNQQALFASLIPVCKIQMPGSNGLNHALVANGGAYAAGAITTAIGGPWDVAGARSSSLRPEAHVARSISKKIRNYVKLTLLIRSTTTFLFLVTASKLWTLSQLAS